MNGEIPQNYVGFSSLFTPRFDFFGFFFFLPDNVVFQLSLFCNTFFEEESQMRFFLAFCHVFSVSGAFPDASCVGVRFVVCLFSALLGI